jgi:DNA-binding MarR family transcriptional regulator
VTKKTDLEDLFLRDKPVRLLLAMLEEEESYVSILAKKTDCTYSHTVKLLDAFKKLGLVTFDKKGRVKFITLTQAGEKLAKDFESLMRRFSRV